jgi:hypothetical protein
MANLDLGIGGGGDLGGPSQLVGFD